MRKESPALPEKRKALLKWQLNFGEHEEWLREQYESGKDVPAIENKPDLSRDPDLAELLENYQILAQTRAPGFSGPGALRLSDIIALYHTEGWEAAEMSVSDYVRIMLDLDSVVQKYHAERQKK